VDFVVVGSGAGGGAAAATLARGGARVCIVEAGAWRNPEEYPSSMYGAMRDLFDDWTTMFTRGRAFWPILQGRVVGGSTLINSAIAVRTPGDVFQRWEREFGLPAETIGKAVWRHQDDLEKELSVEEVPPAARGRANLLAYQGAEAAGYEGHVMRRYVKGCEGSGQCLQGCKKLRKQSTNVTFVPEVLQRGGAVLSCAPVRTVVFDGRRAVGVEGHFVHPQTKKRGARFVVRAKKGVFVAASATHTPVLLMRSGVRNPALGKYFRAHPGTGVFGVYDAPVDMNIGATQGWASTAYRETPGFKLETLAIPPEMVASRLAGGGRELMERLTEYRHLSMVVHACRAESVGSVREGFFGKPTVHYELDEADMLRFREGIKTVARTHFAAGAKAILPCIDGMPYKLGPDDLGLLDQTPLDPRKYIAVLSHLFGGAVMGVDETRSVCDKNGRVHGYQGLVVADAAAIPSNLGVNPQHTIMGLARMYAEAALG
jgi:choline dehydrogenase-like flavoprotein